MLESSIKKLFTISDFDELKDLSNRIGDVNITVDDDGRGISNKKILFKNFVYKFLSKNFEKFIQSNVVCKVNLKKILQNNLYEYDDLLNILDKLRSKDRVIGNLPFDFIDLINENIEDHIKKIYLILEKYSQILNYCYSYQDDSKEYIKMFNKEMAKELSIATKQEIEVDFVGHGVNGNGYKIVFKRTGKVYFYKVFYPYNIRYMKKEVHGGIMEIAYAVYANKNGRHNQFVKFYCGKIASSYSSDSYMITEYLERRNVPVYKQLCVDFLHIPKSEDQRFDNKINGIIVDFGGLNRSSIEELANPQIRKIIRIILNHITYVNNTLDFDIIWKFNKKNFDDLKRYVSKLNTNLYKCSLNIIFENIKNIPTDIKNALLNILSIENFVEIYVKYSLKIEELAKPTLEEVKEVVNFYDINIKSSCDATGEMNGYLIVDLYDDRIGILIFDKDENVLQFKCEKLISGKYENLVLLSQEQIQNKYSSVQL